MVEQCGLIKNLAAYFKTEMAPLIYILEFIFSKFIVTSNTLLLNTVFYNKFNFS